MVLLSDKQLASKDLGCFVVSYATLYVLRLRQGLAYTNCWREC